MKKWWKIAAWVLFVLSITILGIRSQHEQEEMVVDQPLINIQVTGEDAFLTKDELHLRLKRKGLIFSGQKQAQLPISEIEKFIAAMTEVKEVKVNTNIGKKWEIDVKVRKPIARIFNLYNESFYLDDEGEIMESSLLHTARVIVVTGNIADKKSAKNYQDIINNPTLKSIHKIDDIFRISQYVCKDPLMRTLIGQIHLRKNGDFVLVPIVGEQKIIFGSAYTEEEVNEKFTKLKLFYKEAIPFEGWNKYMEINLKYKKQIVGKTEQG